MSPDVGLPLPDLVIFFDAETSTFCGRVGFGLERYCTFFFDVLIFYFVDMTV